MNNYLFANLATGKISGKRGGGAPVFTLGEENPTQVYFLDYPKPSSYSASTPPLGDAYAFSVNPVNKNGVTFNLRCGPAIESAIIDQASWSDLPSTVTGVYTADYQVTSGKIGISGEISLNPTPSGGVFRIRVPYKIKTSITYGSTGFAPSTTTGPTQYSRWVYIPYFASESDIELALSEAYSGLIDFIFGISELPIIDVSQQLPIGLAEYLSSQQRFNKEIEKYNLDKSAKASKANVIQSGDFTFFYSISGTTIPTTNVEWIDSTYTPPGSPTPVTVKVSKTTTTEVVFDGVPNVEINTSSLIAPYGKYGNLNFNSPAWETFLGSENEKEVWIDAALGSSPKVVAQGRAILRKKLSI
jgi:hypothetical protein